MDVEKLKTELELNGVNSAHYSLDGSLSDDAIILDKINETMWRVFYYERGSEYDSKLFTSQTQACEHVLALLKDDQSAKW